MREPFVYGPRGSSAERHLAAPAPAAELVTVNMLDPTQIPCHRGYWTRNEPFSWVCVDIGASRSLIIDHYCLRHGNPTGIGRLQHWQLEGSNDNSQWAVLSVHDGDLSLPAVGFSVAAWPVPGIEEAFRFFRVVQTGLNSQGGHYLYCAGLELYGLLSDNAAY